MKEQRERERDRECVCVCACVRGHACLCVMVGCRMEAPGSIQSPVLTSLTDAQPTSASSGSSEGDFV